MQNRVFRHAAAVMLAAMMCTAAGTMAQSASSSSKSSSHSHTEHKDEAAKTIYKGYFEDDQIKPRTLADWEGDWQSVYPLLEDGTLDPVMQHKADHGDKSAKEYKDYYMTGYKTDVDRITISGTDFTFHKGGEAVTATYADDGYEILNYKKGNRGVRYIFKKTEGDEAAPKIVQFSDHHIFPTKVGHYHLYWGDDRAKILEELTNWPTYYPAGLSGEEIVKEMTAH